MHESSETHARETYEPISTNPNALSTDPMIGSGKRARSCESTSGDAMGGDAISPDDG